MFVSSYFVTLLVKKKRGGGLSWCTLLEGQKAIFIAVFIFINCMATRKKKEKAVPKGIYSSLKLPSGPHTFSQPYYLPFL